MTDPADLSRIQPPAVPPAETPDPKTEEEVKDQGKKLTPTDRMVESHGDHVRTLRNHVARLEGEKDEQQRQLANQITALRDERNRAEAIAVKYAALKSSAGVAGCFSLFGNFLVTGGGIALGVAGAYA